VTDTAAADPRADVAGAEEVRRPEREVARLAALLERDRRVGDRRVGDQRVGRGVSPE